MLIATDWLFIQASSLVNVEFIYDYRSPYAYLANTQHRTLDARVTYEVVDILAVMKTVSNQPTPMCPPKYRYAGTDAARWAARYGVPFAPNMPLLQAMRVREFDGTSFARFALAAQLLGVFEIAHPALFASVWASNVDLLSEAAWRSFWTSKGIPADDILSLAASVLVSERLVANNQAAIEKGVFGVPTYFVGAEMFFGNDRLDFVRERLREAHPLALDATG
jgi:2-hydroxychromene-2-carboxylate isomerase